MRQPDGGSGDEARDEERRPDHDWVERMLLDAASVREEALRRAREDAPDDDEERIVQRFREIAQSRVPGGASATREWWRASWVRAAALITVGVTIGLAVHTFLGEQRMSMLNSGDRITLDWETGVLEWPEYEPGCEYSLRITDESGGAAAPHRVSLDVNRYTLPEALRAATRLRVDVTAAGLSGRKSWNERFDR